MKSLDQIRDELAKQAYLNLLGTEIKDEHATMLFKAGFDAAVAHLQSADIVDGDANLDPEIYLDKKNHKLGSAEFDAFAANQAAEKCVNETGVVDGLEADVRDRGRFKQGARWQFNQMQAEIERLKAESVPREEYERVATSKGDTTVWSDSRTDYCTINLGEVARTRKLEEQLAKLTEALKEITKADVHYFPDGRVSVAETVLIARKALASIAPNGDENE